ncbi:conserved protein of unknown function (Glycoside hydrolase/deacetylase, beta/alpha-barrel 289-560) [Magnetospirillum sp. XM-1]|uniref:hypothetical protein n=1 Tax=Magnetospirillum sp. XM-1 TaxID=1663591 RepID=UPI00073DD390|nr:hypothetical protein [Magnetospirillum sp. XM-1]CUW41617.1 conserved protein of unknown function (Glycoside hydrolase/deacetylase, beta/alpha-barrel 289-560) [Magnetospirillum sp. XM-1]
MAWIRNAVLAGLFIATVAATTAASAESSLWDGIRGFFRGALYRFPDVAGPDGTTTVSPAAPADWRRFGEGGNSRLAILLTDPASDWLALAHGLRTIGVPFVITDDYRKALAHRVVFVYPRVSGQVLPPQALKALAEFPAKGGTLIAQHVLGGGLDKLFGFDEAGPRTATELRFQGRSVLTRGLDDTAETSIRIGGRQVAPTGSYAYSNPKRPPLATYQDGSAAILGDETGRAYAIGPDLGYLLARGYDNRQQDIARQYVNGFEPTLDVLLRAVRNIYRAGEPDAVTLSTVPQGKPLSVIVSHDIDYTRSLENALAYAAFERSRGITATYFMQVKYVRDWNDDVFFTDKGVRMLRDLRATGMEIASHSVSHARPFKDFPLGDGTERYPDYAPFVRNRTVAENGTILGELRVSRFLLEHFLPGDVVSSFRPGHLANPFALPQALAAAGYRFSSSVTANDSLTHLPFQLTHGRENVAETPIFEFPVTVEDELDGPMLDRLPQALALAERLKRYGGLFVVLIHPDILGQKLDFEKKFVEAQGDGVWYGSVSQFGEWWAARDQLGVDAIEKNGRVVLTLVAPQPLEGLTLELPAMWSPEVFPAGLSIRQQANRLVLGRVSGKHELIFTKDVSGPFSGNGPGLR